LISHPAEPHDLFGVDFVSIWFQFFPVTTVKRLCFSPRSLKFPQSHRAFFVIRLLSVFFPPLSYCSSFLSVFPEVLTLRNPSAVPSFWCFFGMRENAFVFSLLFFPLVHGTPGVAPLLPLCKPKFGQNLCCFVQSLFPHLLFFYFSKIRNARVEVSVILELSFPPTYFFAIIGPSP